MRMMNHPESASEEVEGGEKPHEPNHQDAIFDVTCRTSGSLNIIEDRLDQYCNGEWDLVLNALDKNLSKKSIRIIFELSEDREQFVANYGKIQE